MSELLMDQLAGTNMVYARFSFQYFLASMQRLGVHNIELYGCTTHFHFYDGDEAVARAKRLLRDSGLRVISMMPEENVYPVNIAAREKHLRDNTVELYKRFMAAAAELDCHQMLLCPGRPYRDRPYSEGFQYAKESILRLTEYARQVDVVLCYENLRIGESTLATDLNDMERMVREVDSPYLKCCVDTVPVYAAGEKLEDYLERLGDKVHHIHLNDGAPDGHLMWGDGTQDVDEHLNALRRHGYSRYITMEMAAAKYRLDPERFYRQNIEYLSRHFDGGDLSCGKGGVIHA